MNFLSLDYLWVFKKKIAFKLLPVPMMEAMLCLRIAATSRLVSATGMTHRWGRQRRRISHRWPE
jgi:hypothetical protein